MIRYIRDIQARRKGVELEPGFTLIELLIVIVVLGILAATVIFALGGVTSQSAQAACQSDGKSYEVAVAAYENAPANTTNAAADHHGRADRTALRRSVPAPGGQQPALLVCAERRHGPADRLAARRPPPAATVWVRLDGGVRQCSSTTTSQGAAPAATPLRSPQYSELQARNR